MANWGDQKWKKRETQNVNVQAANGKTAGNKIQVIHRLKRNNTEIAKNLECNKKARLKKTLVK